MPSGRSGSGGWYHPDASRARIEQARYTWNQPVKIGKSHRLRGLFRHLLRVRRDESGSLMVVLAVIFVVSLLGLALVGRVFGDLSNSLAVYDVQSARAQALAGLSDAIFRLDQQVPPYQSFCVGSSSSCTVAVVPAARGVQYSVTVDQATGSSATILSQGTSHGHHYTLKATVTRAVNYPFPIFGVSSVTLNGSSGTTSIIATDQYGNGDGANADLGSDSNVTCHGSGSYGTHQVTYDGGSSNCPHWVQGAGSYDPQQPVATCPAPTGSFPPTPCMPSSYQSCPNNGDFSGTSSSPYVLEPGVYDCPNGVNFSGTVNIDYSSTVNDGQVQIYVLPSTGNATVSMAGSTVNQWQVPPSSSSPGVVGDPVDLQVYVSGGGSIDMGSGSNVGGFNGMIYAPGMSATVNGGQLNLTGAFVLNQFVVNGNPNLTVHYDYRQEELGSAGWSESGTVQIPDSSFTPTPTPTPA